MALSSLGGGALGLGSQLVAQTLPVLYPALQQLVARYSASSGAQEPFRPAPEAPAAAR
jgi:hypothetical protein